MTAQKIAVLKFQGDVDRGFQVTLEILRWPVNQRESQPVERTGELPSPVSLMQTYQQWQTAYRNLGPSMRVLRPGRVELNSFRQRRETCNMAGRTLRQDFNRWLRAESFLPIRETWLRHIQSTDQVSVTIRSRTIEIWQLPWHEWDFWQDYQQLEVTFSPLEREEPTTPQLPLPSMLKILVVLGDATGINIEADRHSFEQLGAQAEFLTQPRRQELINALQNHTYDFLCFAGHSRTEDGLGYIDLNSRDSLSLEELRSTLRLAIQNGLRLAIFNSCDGLGLVRALESLQIPYLIVMREPVPDQVAQIFLKRFLQAFSSGIEFQFVAEEARKELKKHEDDFPYASWLPLIWQSASGQSLQWRDPVVDPVTKPLFQLQRFRSIWHSLKVPIGIGLVCGAAMIGLRISGILQPIELQAFDQMMLLRPPNEGVDPKLLIIEITDTDVQTQQRNGEQMQRIPTTANPNGESVSVSLSDQSLERLLKKLARPEYQPSIIGLDLYRDFPVLPQQSRLTELLKDLPVFAICKAENLWKTGIPTINPPPEVSQNRVGFSDFETDQDGILRRHWLSMDDMQWSPQTLCTSIQTGSSFNSFSTQIAFAYLRKQGITAEIVQQGRYKFLKLGNYRYSVLQSTSGGYQNQPISGNQIMLNYRASPEIAIRIPLSQFLTNQIDPGLTKDSIVLIGSVTSDGVDRWKLPNHTTPTTQIPGVIVQAQMISQLVNAAMPEAQRPLIWVWPIWQDGLWILGWTTASSLIIWLVSIRNQSKQKLWPRLIITILIISSTLYGFCFTILLQGGWIPLIPVQIGLMLASGILAIYWLQTPHKFLTAQRHP